MRTPPRSLALWCSPLCLLTWRLDLLFLDQRPLVCWWASENQILKLVSFKLLFKNDIGRNFLNFCSSYLQRPRSLEIVLDSLVSIWRTGWSSNFQMWVAYVTVLSFTPQSWETSSSLMKNFSFHLHWYFFPFHPKSKAF